ncbi:uncharacterized protein, partial [Eurosta solidaginis]|uniref:uncharacterized protein n=1 Tax=Eurosta solidaginis TaxID=178769 RepID=UPI003530C4B0
MNRKTFNKLLRKEKAVYDETVNKFRRLNDSSRVVSDDIPSTSREAHIGLNESSKVGSDDIPSTSRDTFILRVASDDEPLPNAEPTTFDLNIGEEYIDSDSDSERFLFDDDELVESLEETLSLTDRIRSALKGWAIRQKTTQISLTDLLRSLEGAGLKGLPLDARTVMGTSREAVYIRPFPEGELLYLGIQYNFAFEEFNFLQDLERISIDVGIDGLKIFKSSNRALWPILGHVVEFPKSRPFFMACYSGMSKPPDVNSFLLEFCAEVNNLRQNGVKVGSAEVLKEFDIRLFTCDSPARSFVTGVKSHTGARSCPKCEQVGQRFGARMSFSQVVAEPRTDISFKNRVDMQHHLDQFRDNENVLESVNIDMVSQFPLEPMHLVDLGVMKKLLEKLVTRGNVTRMNAKLKFLNSYVPSEFPRRSRDLDQVKNWKSTEYRQFLLYSGLFVLKDCIPDNLYSQFLLLHCGIRLLSCEKSCRVESNVANEMLEEFVRVFAELYGADFVSFNVHGLLHLTDCVKQFGPLDNFSAYKFENYMQYIKKMINSPNNILQQLFLRIEERRNFTDFSKISSMDKFVISSTKDRDSFFYSSKMGSLKIVNQQSEGNTFNVVILTQVADVFREPIV